MIFEIFSALFVLGIPVFLITWYLVRRLYRTGRLEQGVDYETFKTHLKGLKKDKEKSDDFLHRNWMKFGGVIIISTASTLLDEPIADYFEEKSNPSLDKVSRFGDHFGQPQVNYSFTALIMAYGIITNNEWLRDTGVMLIASLTTSGLIQTASKDLVGRARPGKNEGPYSFKPFGGSAYHSFPSGHTMLAVATAWIMAKQIDWIPAKIVFYGIPVLTGASRIYDRAHWFSDIILGSALGIACAETVYKLYPKIKANKSQGLSILPKGVGLSMVYKF